MKKTYRRITVGMEEPVWALLDRLKSVLGRKCRAAGEREPTAGEVIGLVLTKELVARADDVLDESERLEAREAVRGLEPVVGEDVLSEAGTYDAAG